MTTNSSEPLNEDVDLENVLQDLSQEGIDKRKALDESEDFVCLKDWMKERYGKDINPETQQNVYTYLYKKLKLNFADGPTQYEQYFSLAEYEEKLLIHQRSSSRRKERRRAAAIEAAAEKRANDKIEKEKNAALEARLVEQGIAKEKKDADLKERQAAFKSNQANIDPDPFKETSKNESDKEKSKDELKDESKDESKDKFKDVLKDKLKDEPKDKPKDGPKSTFFKK
jgi:hypothetical protein